MAEAAHITIQDPAQLRVIGVAMIEAINGKDRLQRELAKHVGTDAAALIMAPLRSGMHETLRRIDNI